MKFSKINTQNLVFALIIFTLGLLATIPLLAPVLAHFGLEKPAKWIYQVYSLFCHQKAHRSLFIFDEQCAWCARDTFIWTTIFIASIFILKGKKIPGISGKTALLLIIPMALDGGIQLIATFLSIADINHILGWNFTNTFYKQTPFYESTNTLRMLTGTLFGLGISMYLFPRLRDEFDNDAAKSKHIVLETPA